MNQDTPKASYDVSYWIDGSRILTAQVDGVAGIIDAMDAALSRLRCLLTDGKLQPVGWYTLTISVDERTIDEETNQKTDTHSEGF